jgi:RsiW-degrading membrane proteinase PrsW (M82 family)
LFGAWLNIQPKTMKGFIWVGVAALCWAIWRCRNDVILNKLKTNSIAQVIFRGAYWLRSWSRFQRDEHAKDTLIALSKGLELIALDISNRGWNHLYRFALVYGSCFDFGLLRL